MHIQTEGHAKIMRTFKVILELETLNVSHALLDKTLQEIKLEHPEVLL